MNDLTIDSLKKEIEFLDEQLKIVFAAIKEWAEAKFEFNELPEDAYLIESQMNKLTSAIARLGAAEDILQSIASDYPDA